MPVPGDLSGRSGPAGGRQAPGEAVEMLKKVICRNSIKKGVVMCGYCTEGILIGHYLFEELYNGIMMHNNLPVSWYNAVFPQECSNLLEHLKYNQKSDDFGLALNTAYCRLLGFECGARDITAKRVCFTEIRNFLNQFNLCHFKKEFSLEKLQNVYKLIPKGEWSLVYSFDRIFAGELNHIRDNNKILSDCHDLLDQYVNIFLNAQNNNSEYLNAFYTLLPALFYSICKTYKSKKTKTLLIKIASTAPETIDFFAYNLWIRRKVLSLLVDQYGLETAISQIRFNDPGHIYYLYITHNKDQKNLDFWISLLQKYTVTTGYFSTEGIIEAIQEEANSHADKNVVI